MSNKRYIYETIMDEDEDANPNKVAKVAIAGIDDKLNVYAYDNHIYLYSSINKENIIKLNNLIIDINKKVVNANKDYPMFKIEPKPIYLHINSYGGCIFSAFTAIDFITNSSIPIYTIIEGASASAATLISVCGKKRYMCKNASMLIHQLSSGMIGKMSTLDDQYINLNEMMKKIKDIYLTNTTIKKTEIDKLLKHDLWWDLTKCKKYGLFDEIWTGEDNIV